MKGQLSILNLSECDSNLVRSKKVLEKFGSGLCKEIKMKPYKRMIIKRFGKGNLRGYSGVQFIETSSIVVHLDEHENKVFVDIFSCKKFDSKAAREFSKDYFKAKKVECKTIMRK